MSTQRSPHLKFHEKLKLAEWAKRHSTRLKGMKSGQAADAARLECGLSANDGQIIRLLSELGVRFNRRQANGLVRRLKAVEERVDTLQKFIADLSASATAQ